MRGIHLDTNFLIAASASDSVAATHLATWIRDGVALSMSSIAWTEFLCGPVTLAQRQAALVLLTHVEPYQDEDAALAAYLFNGSGRRRGVLVDCMIAAAAIRAGAALATLNHGDFEPLVAYGLDLALPSHS